MCGGDADVFERAEPVLACMGRPTLVGPHGAGQLAKLANQVIVGATIGAVAEALLLARRGGADPAKVIAALAGGFADSPILRLHGARMVDGDYTTKGRSATHLKDLANALDAANETGSPTPYAQLTADLFDALLAHDGDVDHSGLMLELERRVRDRG
jgi:2-hydroxy-3-oxopropionate reductase